MESLTTILLADRAPSLGVTEPGCIALATSLARSHVAGIVTSVRVRMTSGLYKNAFSCGIPNTEETGSRYSAALGVIAGHPEKGLLALEGITEADVQKARQLIAHGKVTVELSEVSSSLYLEATVSSQSDTATVVIAGSHTNVISITVNGKVLFQKEAPAETDGEDPITAYTLADFLHYCDTVPLEEIAPLKEAYAMNLALAQAGLESDRTPITKTLVALNGGRVFSADPLATAHVLTGAAIEARVVGLDKPAMSITGSGSHGIIATMPLYAFFKCKKLDPERLCRATALSYLVTMYIKAYAGRLSAYCGCGIGAGTGMASALTYLLGGGEAEITCTIANMASGITGMICDGGNPGCVLKATTALDSGYKAAMLGLDRVCIGRSHGINGQTPEETMRNMGRIADPGMRETEGTIVEILSQKEKPHLSR
ncbi:MAG: L-serine ammonia-lyase, iron-sulfur-dependent, subunit alpha [Oscillospiraceae bacterium]|nr:L-serine ammonia-lyase, iron-sulfur-dependent, subunit alpha [Oscillospiraceae bacterium]